MTQMLRIRQVARVEAWLIEQSWPWANRNRSEIDRHWAELTLGNPSLFNGQVLIATERQFSDGVLKIGYTQTDYASFLTFRDQGFPDPGTCNCFGLAAVRTNDRRYVLGVMAAHTANAGRIYFPGGTPDLSDVCPDRGVDLAANVLRELEEETGIAAHDVTVLPGWTVVVDGGRTALLRRIDIAATTAALRTRLHDFLAAETEPEFCDFRFVGSLEECGSDQIPPFMKAYLRHAFAHEQAAP